MNLEASLLSNQLRRDSLKDWNDYFVHLTRSCHRDLHASEFLSTTVLDREGSFQSLRCCSFSVPAPTQSILAPKVNHGSRFMCSCGRSFSTEIAIRETTNVEATSPPATPMLSSKCDLKHHQYIQTSVSKRAKTFAMDSMTSLIPTTTLNELVDRLQPPTNMINWHTTNVKHYENSPGSFGTDLDRSASFFVSLQNC